MAYVDPRTARESEWDAGLLFQSRDVESVSLF